MSDIQRRQEPTESAPTSFGATPVEPVRAAAEQVEAYAEVPRSVELSETGKAVVEDIKEIAKDTQRVVEEKMRPAMAEADTKVSQLEGEGRAREAREGQQMVKQELAELLAQLKEGGPGFLNVGKLLAYSPNFRRLVLDFVGIFREALRAEQTDAPGKAASELEELSAKLQGRESKPKAPPQLSAEAADRLANRFIHFLREVHDVPEYREAVAFLGEQSTRLGAVQTLSIALKDRAELTHDEQKVYEAAQQSDAVKVAIRAKVFAEHWLDASLDPLFSALNDVRLHLVRDTESQEVLAAFSKWLQSCLREPSFMEHLDRRRDELKGHLEALRQRAHAEYRGASERLFEELDFLGERLRKDELSLKLSADVSDLMAHLFRDAAGNLTVKPELWTDLKQVLPLVLRKMRFIHIPELVVKEETLDFCASGISISVGELAPKRIQAYFVSDISPSPAEEAAALPDMAEWQQEYDVENLLVVEASRIFADAKSIYFELEKRSFPSLTDSGLADLTIHGEQGMRLRLVFGARRVVAPGAPAAAGAFRLLTARCTIDKLDLRLHSTSHDWMYMVLGPLIRRQLKQRIEQEIERYLVSGDFVEGLTDPEKIMEAVKAATGTD